MVFPESFFEGEFRDGFYISPMMKRAWAAEIEVLGAFDDICRAYGLQYYFAYGSLLGVVRHGGYIPWDDDIDLWMFRKDIMRLNALPDEVFAEKGLVLINSYREETNSNLAWRVDNGRWLNLSPEHLMKYHLCPFATGVDLHVLDTVPDDPAEIRTQDILVATANTLSRTWDDSSRTEREKQETMQKIEEALDVHLDEAMPPKQRLMILSDQAMAMYSDRPAKKVAFVPSRQKSSAQVYEPAWFGTPVEMSFEGFSVPAPRCYNCILERIFGPGYMNPRRTGGMHGYPFYEKQYNAIKQLFEQEGEKLPAFLTE